jgi:hypothetical protein
MVDNLHPETGERLTARTNAYRRVGYDFTVSLNKSASIVRAFAREELRRQLDAARDEARTGMLAAIEADMQGFADTQGLQTPMVPRTKAPTLRSRISRRPPFSNFPLVKGFQSRHSGIPASASCGCLALPGRGHPEGSRFSLPRRSCNALGPDRRTGRKSRSRPRRCRRGGSCGDRAPRGAGAPSRAQA